jgi:hypothetical protein
VIQFLHLKAAALVEIHCQLVKVYRVHVLSQKQVGAVLLEIMGQMMTTSGNLDTQACLL